MPTGMFVSVSPKRGGVPIGGTTGQVLTKNSNFDWDSSWQNSSGGGAITSIFGRTGIVTAQTGDYSFSLISGTLGLSQISMSTGKLLGRSTIGSGAAEEISIGTNLTLAGGVLNATGGSGTVLTGKKLYVDGTNGNDGTGARGDLTKPYLTITAAVAAASAGDVVLVGPGTFAHTTALQLPANVSLVGSGIDVTKITNSVIGVGTNHAVLAPGTGSIISDLTVDATNNNSNPTAPMGVLSSDSAATNAIISRVKLVGSSDGFYYDKAGTTGIKHYDCIVSTTFDTTYHSTGTFEYFNCDFSGDGTVGGALSCRGLNTAGGAIARAYGCKFTMINPAGESVSGYATAAGSTTELYNCRSAVSGSTSFDLKQVSSATVNYSNVTRSDGAALTTSGTITNLSRYLIRDNNLSDIITPATALSNLGGVPTGRTLTIAGTAFDLTANRTWTQDNITGLSSTGIVKRTGANTLAIATAKTDYWDTTDFVASGASHSHGLVPDPGASAGTVKFLREDATWATPAGGGTVTAVTGTPPITSTGGTTPAIGLDVSVDHAFTAQQSIKLNDAVTSGVSTPLIISHDTTGTPANGLGTGITFQGESSTTTDQPMGSLSYIWTDITNATRTSRCDVNAVVNGSINTVASFFGNGIGGGSLNVGSTTNPGTSGIINANAGFRIANAAASRKKLVGDGTNFIASTETWAVPGTSGNVLTSDGTNWLSSAPASPSAPLTLTLTNATTATVDNVLTLDHESSGTPAVGFGAGCLFKLQDNTTAAQSAAAINAIWTNATHATHASKLVVQLSTGGAALADKLWIYGDAGMSLGQDSDVAGVMNVLTGFRVNGTPGASGSILQSDGSALKVSGPAWPTTAGTSGKVVQSNGSDFTQSTSTYPSAAGTANNKLVSDGTNWTSVAYPDVQKFTATGAGTWTKPTAFTPQFVKVICISAGGGGGGGASQTGAVVRTGGGGGGGGCLVERTFTASDLGSTESLSVGAGGISGAAGASGASGGDGGIGGDSTFGTAGSVRVWAGGGGGGRGGQNAGTATGGGGGGGIGKAGSTGAATGGNPGGSGQNSANNEGMGCRGSAGSIVAGAPNSCDMGGSGGGGVSATGGAISPGGTSMFGGGGGGGGASATVTPALTAAQAGGNTAVVDQNGAGGGAAGTSGAAPTAGTAGAAGTSVKSGQGGGGGGGTITANTAGAAGGNGGACGGGGGGGGVGSNTGIGGAGGVGGRGEIRVYSW